MSRMSMILAWGWSSIQAAGGLVKKDPLKAIEALSAAVVAGVAAYGLFFTVIPLYSKAVIEEQKAKLEQEVNDLQVRTKSLNELRDRWEEEARTRKEEVEILKEKVESLKEQVETLSLALDRGVGRMGP